MSKSSSEMKTREAFLPRGDDAVFQLGVVLTFFLLLTLISIIFTLCNIEWLRAIGIVSLTGLLGLAIGSLIGFLFGLPKTVVRSGGNYGGALPSATSSTPASANAAQSNRLLSTNTNLEELSDWLTKIFVGLGLTQIGQINTYMLDFEEQINKINGPHTPFLPLCAVIVLATCAIMGFLWMYLEARTFLTKILNSSEDSLNSYLTAAISKISTAANVTDAAMGPAASALKDAAELKPDDANLRSAAVKALTVSGRTGDAAAILATGASTSIEDQLSKMFISLYQLPDGYIKVLAISDDLKDNPDATGKGEYWFYRAAALGQKYAQLKLQKDAPQADLDATRSDLLEAVQKAISINSNFKVQLLALANPRPGSADDDLVSISADPDFQQLVR